MAAYDTVPQPGAPDLTKGPVVDFSALSQIPGAFQEGQQYQQKRAEQTAFKDGLPRDEHGNLDFNQIADKLVKVGGAKEAPGVMNMILQRQSSQNIQDAINPPTNGQAAGPGNVAGPAQQPGAPQPGPSNSPGAPSQAPTSAVSMATDSHGDQLAGRVAQAALKSAGINQPIDAPLSPEQQSAVADVLRKIPHPAHEPGEAQGGPPFAPGTPSVRTPAQPGGPQVAQGGPEPQQGGQQQPQDAAASDPRWAEVDRLGAIAKRALAASAGIGVTPQQAQAAQKTAEDAQKRAQQLAESIYKDHALTDPQKESIGAGDGLNTAAHAGTVEYSKEDAKRYVKIAGEVSTGKAEADKERPQLGLIKSIMADPGFYSGAGAGLVQKYKQWTVALGGDPNAGVPQEAFGKAVQNLALSQIRSMAGTGPVRVAEMRIIQQAIANKDYTPATNRLLVEMADRNYSRNQQLATMAREYSKPTAQGGHGRLDQGFEETVSKWDQAHPLFSEAELADPRIIAPPRFHTPAEAEAAGLPKGTPYSDMSGKHLKMTQ